MHLIEDRNVCKVMAKILAAGLLAVAVAVAAILIGQAPAIIADARADAGSYLAAAHEDPDIGGASDFWLMAAGTKACAGGYIPNTPAGQAVTRIAHQELCP